MRESEFTPGPWGFHAESGRVFRADGDVEPTIAWVEQENTSDERAAADGALIAAAPDLYEALDEGDAAWAEAMILIAAKPHDNDRARLAAERLHAWNDKRKAALRKAGKQFCATCNADDPPHAPGCAAHSPGSPQTDCMEQP